DRGRPPLLVCPAGGPAAPCGRFRLRSRRATTTGLLGGIHAAHRPLGGSRAARFPRPSREGEVKCAPTEILDIPRSVMTWTSPAQPFQTTGLEAERLLRLLVRAAAELRAVIDGVLPGRGPRLLLGDPWRRRGT